MIMGEHAVVYGYPCIATAVDKYLSVTVKKIEGEKDIFTTPGVSDQRFVRSAVKVFRQKFSFPEKIALATKSEIGNWGLGTSSATVVATLKALSLLFGIPFSQKDLFNFSFEATKKIHRLASGFDIAAAIFGGTIYYRTPGLVVNLPTDNSFTFVVGYSGVKADTSLPVLSVAEKYKKYKKGIEKIFANIGDLVEKAKQAMLDKDLIRFGTLMNYNQDYLEDLGVSTKELNKMIQAARKAGAYGAKLSGAGGGDCMIALIPQGKRKNIEEAIKGVDGVIIKTETNADRVGVKNIL